MIKPNESIDKIESIMTEAESKYNEFMSLLKIWVSCDRTEQYHHIWHQLKDLENQIFEDITDAESAKAEFEFETLFSKKGNIILN